ncbi:MAG: hypothetical protein ABGY96_11995 [bacterium]|nr:hypothetical protein [Gammaproteobacteria bacterium]HIL97521.1 hypothetical protein [Pseudomonadales bacterium]
MKYILLTTLLSLSSIASAADDDLPPDIYKFALCETGLRVHFLPALVGNDSYKMVKNMYNGAAMATGILIAEEAMQSGTPDIIGSIRHKTEQFMTMAVDHWTASVPTELPTKIVAACYEINEDQTRIIRSYGAKGITDPTITTGDIYTLRAYVGEVVRMFDFPG